jgi:hypothetical protein
MPCNTIQTAVVELGKAQPDLLLAALNRLGLSAVRHSDTIYFGRFLNGISDFDRECYDIKTGQLRLETTRDVAEIKRAYSHQVVQSQAKKFGWQMKQVGDKYQVVRR